MSTTVFVSGNFNIVHPGHLRLLKFARESGQKLVVGVISDKLAENRSLLPQELRLEGVRATNYVDESFILDIPVTEYIKSNKPDIVVKGKEYENRFNPESEVVTSYGGQLIFSSGEIAFSSLSLLHQEFLSSKQSHATHETSYINRHNILPSELLDLVIGFKNVNVLVIGDSIVDEYVSCDALGMSQEDPTIVVSPIKSDKFIGGAAIVAAHCSSLGANTSFISMCGTDSEGELVESSLKKLSIETKLIKDATRPTTHKKRYRAQGKTLLRVNKLKQHDMPLPLQEEALNHIKGVISNIDLIIFSDFSYGVVTENLIKDVEQLAHQNSIPICADSQSSSQVGDISKFSKSTLVTPTEREIRLALNDFDSGLVVLSEKLRDISKTQYIFTTLGSEGVLIYNSNKDELLTDQIGALNSSPKDVSGAGDSLLTGTALALACGGNIWQSAYIGSLCAAIQVSRLGNTPITQQELQDEIGTIK